MASQILSKTTVKLTDIWTEMRAVDLRNLTISIFPNSMIFSLLCQFLNNMYLKSQNQPLNSLPVLKHCDSKMLDYMLSLNRT